MHIEALKTFCDLVETQSFSFTAERNFITQPAVSQQLRSLENKFTRRLLERGHGRSKIHLTSEGEIFYRECKNILANYAALHEEIYERVGLINTTVKVAAVFSVGLYKLPPKMREFMKKFPQAKIDLEYNRAKNVMNDVLDGNVELGIIGFPEAHRALTMVPMESDRLVLICPPTHELATRQQIKITELNNRDFVLFESGVPTRKATDIIIKSYGVTMNKTVEFNNIETIKGAVEIGLGLAIVPHSSVANEERRKQLAAVKLAEKEWVRPVGVIYRRDRTPSVAAKKFVQLLATEI